MAIDIKSLIIGMALMYMLSCVAEVWIHRVIREYRTFKKHKEELKERRKLYEDCKIGFVVSQKNKEES